jgi:hypothetical protein
MDSPFVQVCRHYLDACGTDSGGADAADDHCEEGEQVFDTQAAGATEARH